MKKIDGSSLTGSHIPKQFASNSDSFDLQNNDFSSVLHLVLLSHPWQCCADAKVQRITMIADGDNAAIAGENEMQGAPSLGLIDLDTP